MDKINGEASDSGPPPKNQREAEGAAGPINDTGNTGSGSGSLPPSALAAAHMRTLDDWLQNVFPAGYDDTVEYEAMVKHFNLHD